MVTIYKYRVMQIDKNSNFSDPLSIIVLAAGLGKRMKSDLPKVLASVLGLPMINRIIREIIPLSPENIVVVTGHKGELVRSALIESFSSTKIGFALQKELLGTGDAAKCGLSEIKDFSGTVLILAGDTPLIKGSSLLSLLNVHQKENATVTLLSFMAKDPTGYGRVVRESGLVSKIVEEKDASDLEKQITEVNSGIYAVDSAFLYQALNNLETNNVQGELYLTDILGKAATEGQHISSFLSNDESQFLGVNTKSQLNYAQTIAMKRKIESLIEQGVSFLDPNTVYIEEAVVVGEGSSLGPNVQLRGKTTVGKSVKIEGSAFIQDSTIEDGATIKFGVRIEGAHVGKNAAVGPFAHLRPEAYLEKDVKVGNFVEIKKSRLKEGAKASHLTYLGDAEVGKDANIGAGTITCNYDGYNKFKTTIGDGAFIGSNTALVAPVTIGAGAVIGAGSVISKEVSKDALALERTEQREIKDWAKKRRVKSLKK